MAMARFLNRLRPVRTFPALEPRQHPVCIIGDVHGRLDLLDIMLDQLSALPSAGALRVILVGDLIDRGPDSASVLARVRDCMNRPAPFAELHCLMGNHERMMLDFIEAPHVHGPRWLANGGDATLQSFGLSPYHRSGAAQTRAGEGRLTGMRDALLEAMPRGLGTWLGGLPVLWQDGQLVVVHAGADPARPIPQQSSQNLVWGHPDFLTRQRHDGIWIAHGHTITATPEAVNGRISVDTGAYRTGTLTAAWLEGAQLQFLSARQPA
jgi:serine/threonine protein phosphatase 1